MVPPRPPFLAIFAPIPLVDCRQKKKQKNQKNKTVSGPLWTLEEFWWCRPSVWTVYGKGQSAVALTCFSLRKELPLSPIFFFFPFTTTDREYWSLQWSGFSFSFFFFSNSPFSFCVYMQEGGATLPSQLLMIMSAQIMTILASVQRTPVVHRPFIDVVECVGTHHRKRILHPCLFPF